jgi:hypothetical protein
MVRLDERAACSDLYAGVIGRKEVPALASSVVRARSDVRRVREARARPVAAVAGYRIAGTATSVE